MDASQQGVLCALRGSVDSRKAAAAAVRQLRQLLPPPSPPNDHERKGHHHEGGDRRRSAAAQIVGACMGVVPTFLVDGGGGPTEAAAAALREVAELPGRARVTLCAAVLESSPTAELAAATGDGGGAVAAPPLLWGALRVAMTGHGPPAPPVTAHRLRAERRSQWLGAALRHASHGLGPTGVDGDGDGVAAALAAAEVAEEWVRECAEVAVVGAAPGSEGRASSTLVSRVHRQGVSLALALDRLYAAAAPPSGRGVAASAASSLLGPAVLELVRRVQARPLRNPSTVDAWAAIVHVLSRGGGGGGGGGCGAAAVGLLLGRAEAGLVSSLLGVVGGGGAGGGGRGERAGAARLLVAVLQAEVSSSPSRAAAAPPPGPSLRCLCAALHAATPSARQRLCAALLPPLCGGGSGGANAAAHAGRALFHALTLTAAGGEGSSDNDGDGLGVVLEVAAACVEAGGGAAAAAAAALPARRLARALSHAEERLRLLGLQVRVLLLSCRVCGARPPCGRMAGTGATAPLLIDPPAPNG
jgi:hypothetical protein